MWENLYIPCSVQKQPSWWRIYELSRGNIGRSCSQPLKHWVRCLALTATLDSLNMLQCLQPFPSAAQNWAFRECCHFALAPSQGRATHVYRSTAKHTRKLHHYMCTGISGPLDSLEAFVWAQATIGSRTMHVSWSPIGEVLPYWKSDSMQLCYLSLMAWKHWTTRSIV